MSTEFSTGGTDDLEDDGDLIVRATCHWTNGLDLWESGCGKEFMLDIDSPKASGIIFCCYCGKTISS